MSDTAPLLDLADRQLSDASLEAYAHVAQTLNAREIETFILICQYLEQTGYPDVSGEELAEWAQRDKTSIRPRCTGLCDKGWCAKGPIRPSRAAGEGRVHGVYAVLPRAAVERARKAQKKAAA